MFCYDFIRNVTIKFLFIKILALLDDAVIQLLFISVIIRTAHSVSLLTILVIRFHLLLTACLSHTFSLADAFIGYVVSYVTNSIRAADHVNEGIQRLAVIIRHSVILACLLKDILGQTLNRLAPFRLRRKEPEQLSLLTIADTYMTFRSDLNSMVAMHGIVKQYLVCRKYNRCNLVNRCRSVHLKDLEHLRHITVLLGSLTQSAVKLLFLLLPLRFLLSFESFSFLFQRFTGCSLCRDPSLNLSLASCRNARYLSPHIEC